MKEQRLLELKELYKKVLLDDVVSFWIKHSLDRKNGGYYHYLDRDGSILSKDKSVWIQGREAWLFAKLYNSFEKREEWLEASALGYEFLKSYCFDIDGRMFFQVTFDGRPFRDIFYNCIFRICKSNGER
jgi:N-acylglucosamine 2-epimerase